MLLEPVVISLLDCCLETLDFNFEFIGWRGLGACKIQANTRKSKIFVHLSYVWNYYVTQISTIFFRLFAWKLLLAREGYMHE